MYRNDIDGLRAIAVVSVILFHLGYLPNGYLGVDIFFAISGYLITGIAYKEVEESRFSALRFYERRIRRIVPLVLFSSLVALVLGLLFMLPDDLENLCQSIFASNVSANNILMKITSADYWAVKNDFKPLMHTWSLGIEEQFYFLYPFIFVFLNGKKKVLILPLLVTLTMVSLTGFILSSNASAKFYLLQYRFFELSLGGIGAIYFRNIKPFVNFHKDWLILILLLVLIVLQFGNKVPNDIKLIITVILTVGLLGVGGIVGEKSIYGKLMSNKIIAGIGKISFSLYMWHQIVFAFSRYFLFDEISLGYAILLFIVVLLASILSYFFIEKPFRNRATMSTKSVFICVACSFLLINGASLFVYAVGGIIRDVPELGIKKSTRPKQLNFFSTRTNINIQYNGRVREFDRPFSDSVHLKSSEFRKIKVLVIGNSFGRDVSNILLESSFKDLIELRYSESSKIELATDFVKRVAGADFILVASGYSIKQAFEKFRIKYNIDTSKVAVVGIKDFGNSNGIHYNKKVKDFENYRAPMKEGVFKNNQRLKKEWRDKYVDLIGLIADEEGKVLVFTPDGKFISQDTVHLTKFGAIFFAKLLDLRLREILKIQPAKL